MSDLNITNSFRKPNLIRQDRILLLIVLLLGIAGLVFLLSMKKEPVLVTEKEKALPIISEKPADRLSTAIIETSSVENNNIKSSNTSLFIKGEHEVGLPLSISVNNLEKDVNYVIDFGNGTKKNLTSSTINYAYNRPGKYVVSIKAIYQGQSKVIDSQSISIADEIQIVQKAND